MSTITTRAGKGSPLTNNEVDANFTNLNTDKAELSGAAFTGAITTTSTVDGRDVATDGSKLDGIEAGADVTDTTNVTAAGALMDSELTAIASVKALNQGVATTDSPTFVGLTTSGEITANGGIALGDNDKATFGASDDLQIYHDGSNSHIKDTATGNLNISGNDIQILNAASNEAMAYFAQDGGVTLYHNGSEKTATTSTGIDVTGTATMDGLTVTGADNALAASIGTAAQRVYITPNGTEINYNASGNSAGSHKFQSGNVNRLNIASNGDISFYEDTGTTPKLFWDASAESLGIGETSPLGKLHIKGTDVGATASAQGNSLVLEDSENGLSILSSTAGAGYINFGDSDDNDVGMIIYGHSSNSMNFWTNATERMRIDSAGNVGIGTSSPSAKIHATTATAGYAAKLINTNGASDANGLLIQAGTVSSEYALNVTNTAGTTNFMVVKGNGNVGIGTSSPTGELHVKSASGNANFYLQRSVYDPWRLSAGSSYLSFLQNSSEKMRISSAGQVSIGSSFVSGVATKVLTVDDPSNAAIVVAHNGATALNLYADADEANIGSYLQGANMKFFTTPSGGSTTERLRITSAGNLLVGTTAGSFGARITAQSTASYTFESRRTGTGSEGHIVFRNANGAVGTIFTNGTSTSYNTSSDQRLKENIADADDAGSKIDSIQVRKYDWKADGSHQDYGMVAQELQLVAPEAVSGDADSEEMMGVDYSKLVPMLIKEIQSLRNRVAQLEE